MKKTVKFLISTAFAIGLGSFAKAQSADITANATVISEMVIASVANLNFGTVVAGQIKTITYYSDAMVSTGTPLGSANRGAFTVSAQAGSDVRLTFNLPTSLSGPNMKTLPIYFSWQDPIMGDIFRTGLIESPDVFQTYDPTLGELTFYENRFPTTQAIPGVNSVNVYIGGRVDATGMAAGVYSGTITLSATYN